MDFFKWFSEESDDNRLSKFWKKMKDFLTGKSGKDPIPEVNEVFEESTLDAVNREFIPLIQSGIRDGNHLYTKHAVSNIFAESSGDGKVAVGIRDAPYFGRVEFGTEPRTVDSAEFNRLIHWVRVKDTENEILDPRAMAAAVAKTIRDEGNTEYAVFSNALDAVQGKLTKKIIDGIEWRFD